MPNNSVPLTTAQTDITNWKDYCINNELADRVKAINIPLDSLTPLLNLAEVVSIRAYFGLPNSSTMENMCLFIVGVDADGKDIIVDNDNNSLIMDFTSPCPKFCDTTSPLNI